MANVVSSEVKRSEFLTLLASWPRSWFWLLSLDLYPALSAAALPWSTTAVLIFMIVWFVVLLPTLDFREFYAQLARPANSLPAVLFALAVLGMFWAHDTWDVRLRGLSPVAKLVAIPFLLYHFERSKRGHWVFIAFLGSCSLLMAFSWLVYFAPGWKIGTSIEPGIPIRNYIDQKSRTRALHLRTCSAFVEVCCKATGCGGAHVFCSSAWIPGQCSVYRTGPDSVSLHATSGAHIRAEILQPQSCPVVLCNRRSRLGSALVYIAISALSG